MRGFEKKEENSIRAAKVESLTYVKGCPGLERFTKNEDIRQELAIFSHNEKIKILRAQ